VAEKTNATVKRYLAIPAGQQRLKVLHDNLNALVSELVKDEPKDINVHIPLPVVLLDLVREVRALRGDLSGEDSTASTDEPSQSSPVIRVEQVELVDMET
jgi:hypothetical protein